MASTMSSAVSHATSSVVTIEAGVAFLDALASGLLAEVEGDPSALADALVLLPNRRACRGLAEAFLRQSQGRALLLPRIQPIGEVDAEELMLDGTLELDLPPSIGPLRRQLLLARLLADRGWPFAHALRLATDLASLLDEMQTECCALGDLDQLVPDDLAAHWQKSRDLLAIVAEQWPGQLARIGALDPAVRRQRLLTGLAARWLTAPPERRIVAAGSTGSIPATRVLMAAIATLPRGLVVLPGLDRAMDEDSWRAMPATHPQWGLGQLLAALGIERATVAAWPATVSAGAGPARLHLMREVMRPAATIHAWHDLPDWTAAATAGLAIEKHGDLAAEALAIALRMRAVLETPARTAALVTPDRALARRVAVELRRWSVTVDDSAGTPLDQTPPGAFLLLTARLVMGGITPAQLLAVLKHPFATAGQDAWTFRRRVRQLERHCLRGPRLAGGFEGILAELARERRQPRNQARADLLHRLTRWVDGLAQLAHPATDLATRPRVSLTELTLTHLAFAEDLARDRAGQVGDLWRREAGEAAARLFEELLEASHDQHEIAPAAYPALLGRLMATRPVRPRNPRHARLFVWGELEARLQQADLIILGGLNEDVWPRRIDPGPWLNRTMREQLGLPPVERRLGLAAHDFAQLAAAPVVVLSRATKDALGQPTVPSRWLVRLQTLLDAKAATAPVAGGEPWRTWCEALDAVDGKAVPHGPPKAAPPVAARPRRMSISDVGRWMRDPYALYAKRVLGLHPLEALDADPGALERGIIIHEALEAFVRAHPGALPPAARQRLLDLGREQFARYAHRPQVKALWWPRFEAVVDWVIAREEERRPELVGLLAEVEGELTIAAPAGPFVLQGRADRLERHPDGRLTVIDYKTGNAPDKGRVASGREPQLPLEAAMIRAGAFAGVAATEVAGLLFWSLRGDGRGCAEVTAAPDPTAAAEAALAGLGRLVAHYDDPDTTYPAPPRPRTTWRDDYEHLARREEWS